MDWLIELLVALMVAVGGAGGEHVDAPEVETPEAQGPELQTPGSLEEIAAMIAEHLAFAAGFANEEALDNLQDAADAASDGLTKAQEAIDAAGEATGAETGAAPFEAPPVPAGGAARPDFAGRP
jgi:hypothetical protein